MDDHAAGFITQLFTFLATLAGIIGGTIRSRNKAELAFAQVQADFWKAELERTRARESDALKREGSLRVECSDQRRELRVMHHEYDAARQSRMVKGKAEAALVVVDSEGIITDVSENIPLYVGWTPSQLIGKSIAIITPEEWRQKQIDGIKAASATGKKVTRGESEISSFVELLHKDKSLIKVSVALIGGGNGKDARYTGSIRFRSSDSGPQATIKLK